MATQVGHSEIDYMAIFRHLPIPIVLLTPEFVIADANLAYLRVSGRDLDDLRDRHVLDAFPDNPAEPSATGASNLSASLRRVLASGECDSMALQKYDVEAADRPGVFEERYWSPVNAPITGPDGQTVLIAHCVEEVSDLVRQYAAAQAASVLGTARARSRPGQASTGRPTPSTLSSSPAVSGRSAAATALSTSAYRSISSSATASWTRSSSCSRTAPTSVAERIPPV
jgi:PAS domain-containing protein